MPCTSEELSWRFASIVEKVQRAKKHISDYCVAVRNFVDSDPYGLVGQSDSQTGKVIFEATKFTPVPPPLLAIGGDGIHNLRSALDYLAATLVLLGGSRITKDTGFPILDEPIATKKTAFDNKVKGMGKQTIDKIAALKPHKGGDDVLWRLHRLDIIDKHHLFFAAGTAVSTFNPKIGPVVRDARGLMDIEQTLANTFTPIPGAFPLNKSTKFTIEPSPLESDQNLYFVVEVALNQPGVAEGIPLLGILQESMRKVRRIIRDFIALPC